MPVIRCLYYGVVGTIIQCMLIEFKYYSSISVYNIYNIITHEIYK